MASSQFHPTRRMDIGRVVQRSSGTSGSNLSTRNNARNTGLLGNNRNAVSSNTPASSSTARLTAEQYAERLRQNGRLTESTESVQNDTNEIRTRLRNRLDTPTPLKKKSYHSPTNFPPIGDSFESPQRQSKSRQIHAVALKAKDKLNFHIDSSKAWFSQKGFANLTSGLAKLALGVISLYTIFELSRIYFYSTEPVFCDSYRIFPNSLEGA